MPRSGPRPIHRYSKEFKRAAVRLSQVPGMQVKTVATHALRARPPLVNCLQTTGNLTPRCQRKWSNIPNERAHWARPDVRTDLGSVADARQTILIGPLAAQAHVSRTTSDREP